MHHMVQKKDTPQVSPWDTIDYKKPTQTRRSMWGVVILAHNKPLIFYRHRQQKSTKDAYPLGAGKIILPFGK